MQFDDAFFTAIGLDQASEADKAEMIEQLAELVQGRVALKLSDALTPEQLEHFDQLIESKGDEAGLAYVAEVYPEYDALLQGEIEAVKAEFAGDVTTVRNELAADANTDSSHPS